MSHHPSHPAPGARPLEEVRELLEYELTRFSVPELTQLVLELFDVLIERVVRAESGGGQ